MGQTRTASGIAALCFSAVVACAGSSEPSARPLVPTTSTAQTPTSSALADAAAPPEPAPPTGAWLSAADSTARAFPRQDRCLSETGCPFRSAVIPVCTGNPEPVSVERALAMAASDSRGAVMVRGVLQSPPRSTLLVCSQGSCCNTTRADLFLVPPDTDPIASGKALRLAESKFPEAFHCSGDDSMVCCGVDARSGVVLVWGLLKIAEPSGLVVLDKARICRVRERSRDAQ